MTLNHISENTNTDEISLIDIIIFFQKHWRFLGIVTLLLSLGITGMALSKPKNFTQKLTIAIELNLTNIQLQNIDIGQIPRNIDLPKVNNLGVEFLTNLENDKVDLQATYNAENQNIDITLTSSQTTDLTDKSDHIITQLQDSFKEKIKSDLDNSLQSLNRNIQKNELILKDLESQISQSSNNVPRLEALELQRTAYIINLSSLKVDRQFLDNSKVNIAEFTEKVLPVKIIKKSPIEQQSSSLLKVYILAAIASFMVAVFSAVILEQIKSLKQELTQNQVDELPKESQI